MSQIYGGLPADATFATITATGAVTVTGRVNANADLFLTSQAVLVGDSGSNGTGLHVVVSGYANNADGGFFGSVYLFTANGNYPATSGLAGIAAASVRLGLAPSATPIAQTFTIGESSRPGTDTNVGGAAATLRPGLGTGTGVAPKFAIQGVVVTGSGSGAQSYTDMVAVTGVALGFYGATPVAQQTGVAVSAAGIHAALVALGLITA